MRMMAMVVMVTFEPTVVQSVAGAEPRTPPTQPFTIFMMMILLMMMRMMRRTDR